ncbi:hypothetical protein WME90_05555 [Sorangium sp. So ce375]|uniref:hypothetical protein n=1 Tax=Sorangium sp. So ce375 TaxID=3133306 RepID=UPI003F5BCC23
MSDFAPLDEAIPELSGKGGSAGADGPVDAAPEARAANEAASASPGQVPAACEVAERLEADLEAPESGGLVQPASVGLGELAIVDHSPRAAVVASLAGTLSRAAALGDGEAARVVHEAIGRLLGLEPEGRGRSRR